MVIGQPYKVATSLHAAVRYLAFHSFDNVIRGVKRAPRLTVRLVLPVDHYTTVMERTRKVYSEADMQAAITMYNLGMHGLRQAAALANNVRIRLDGAPCLTAPARNTRFSADFVY